MSVYMVPPAPSTMGRDSVDSSIFHPLPLEHGSKVALLRQLFCMLFDEAKVARIAHFNDMNFSIKSIFIKSNINNLIKIEDTPYKSYVIWTNMDKSLIIGAHTDILLIACYMPPEGATIYKSNNYNCW